LIEKSLLNWWVHATSPHLGSIYELQLRENAEGGGIVRRHRGWCDYVGSRIIRDHGGINANTSPLSQTNPRDALSHGKHAANADGGSV